MIQSYKFSKRIQGLWTSLDDILNWIGAKFADCGDGGVTHTTPLDEFLKDHGLFAYQDGEGSDRDHLKWEDVIPME
jgi:hypothetical protein